MKSGKLKGKEEEIIRLYEVGESACTLARMFGVSVTPICGLLKKANKTRTASQSGKIAHQKGRYDKANLKKRKFDYGEAVRLYKSGLSCREIEEKLGIGNVWKAVHSAGASRSILEAMRLAQAKGRWQSPFKLGEEHPDWKGGRRLDRGYVYIYKPDHPRAGKRHKTVGEHILVWEEAHGKPLPQGWIVHHLNGIRDDNRPVNLVAFSKKKHSLVLQAKAKRIQELEAILNGQKQLL